MSNSPFRRCRQPFAALPLTAAISTAVSTTAMFLPSTAMAQLEEVVVTARARAESLQDVPSTVTAFTASQISDMGIQRAEDFISQTPGVSFVNTVETGDSSVSIRGMTGARDAETNFALIIDGILYINTYAFNREYADLEQIEILKRKFEGRGWRVVWLFGVHREDGADTPFGPVLFGDGILSVINENPDHACGLTKI